MDNFVTIRNRHTGEILRLSRECCLVFWNCTSKDGAPEGALGPSNTAQVPRSFSRSLFSREGASVCARTTLPSAQAVRRATHTLDGPFGVFTVPRK